MPDASVDKSVVNWLMHVISGKDTEEPETTQSAEEQGGTTSETVAIGEPPHAETPAAPEPEKALDAISTFTAEDLCGAPVVPIVPIAHSQLDEITAEDLCFVPNKLKPQTDAVADVLRPAGPQLVQSLKQEVTAEGVSREGVEAAETETSAAVEGHGPVPVDMAEVDIARPSATETDAAPEVEWQPMVKPEPEAAGPELVEPNAAEAMSNAESVAEPVAETPVIEANAAAAESHTGESTSSDAADQKNEHNAVTEGEPDEITVSAFFRHYETQMSAPPSAESESAVEPAQLPTVSDSTFRVEGPAANAEPALFQETEEVASDAAGEGDRAEKFAMHGHGLDPEFLKEIEERPERWNAAWKAMMRLGSMMPWLSRFSPMFEGGEQSALSKEVRHEVSGLRLLQYEIKTTIQDHSLQLKRLEDELTKVRESVESDSTDGARVMESMKSTARLVRMVGIGIGALLLVLILMIAIMMAHGR